MIMFQQMFVEVGSGVGISAWISWGSLDVLRSLYLHLLLFADLPYIPN